MHKHTPSTPAVGKIQILASQQPARGPALATDTEPLTHPWSLPVAEPETPTSVMDITVQGHIHACFPVAGTQTTHGDHPSSWHSRHRVCRTRLRGLGTLLMRIHSLKKSSVHDLKGCWKEKGFFPYWVFSYPFIKGSEIFLKSLRNTALGGKGTWHTTQLFQLACWV